MADRKQKLLAQAACDFSRFLFGVSATSKDTKGKEALVKPHDGQGDELCEVLPKPTSTGPLSAGSAAVDVASSNGCISELSGTSVASSSAPVALQSLTAPPDAAAATGPRSSEGRAPVGVVATVAISCDSSCRVSACHALSSQACKHASSAPDLVTDCAGEVTLSPAEDCAVTESESADCRASAEASVPPMACDPMPPRACTKEATCKRPTRSEAVTIVRGDSLKDESDVVMLSSSPSASEASDDGSDLAMLPEAAKDCSLGQEAIDLDTEESDSLTTSEDEDSSTSSSEAFPEAAVATVAPQKNARESLDAPAPMSSFEAVAGSPMTKREVKHASVRQQQPAMTKWRQGKGQLSPEASDIDADESIDVSPELDSDSDSLDEMPSSERKDDRPPKTKGELAVEDLPPIKELQISVPETVALQDVGTVSAIVDALVVIQSRRELSALDIDTVLFLEGRKPMGKIFEVFGPVPAPLYSVRFNSAAEITSRGVAIGLTVYYAPSERKLTRYVFVEQLKTVKGSDASWKDNNEPPREVIDYSDDEKERLAKSNRRRRGRPHDENGAAAYDRPTADAEVTVSADPAAENSSYSRTRRGRGRGNRARPFSTQGREPAESFIMPGANAARWEGRGDKRGGHASQHDWSKPPPSLPGAAGHASPFSVPPPPLPSQAMHHQPYGQSQQWASPATGPELWHHPPPWPQVKQEPCEQGTPECRAAAWSQAQQSTWPPAQATPWHQAWEQQYVSEAAHLANGDGTAAAATGGPAGAGKGAVGKRGRAMAATTQPAVARLPFIIDTRYVQNSQQSTDDGGSDAAPSAGVKPCSNWPDYDDE